ncbi:HAD hydrolase family protein [Vibrio sp. SS-MA-C1-2]|uniref:HAD family hydrolase n=1 Tax=Vibrio sp. SS-MA-C1-2 TaxID=2908646 RepID=UPI001F3D69B8|nr:HAD hydrolase family protein [Vibrio sp. SS-MA-C1-2]UJF17787.1 HAD hydrolase family protein [Vibrio sp. SS-MA-C1-2]
MITITLPNETMTIEHVVFDFNGTLAVDGKLIDSVEDKLVELSHLVDIHVLTADTFSSATDELKGLPLSLICLEGKMVGREKLEAIRHLDLDTTVTVGNGLNDIFMLQAAKVGIAVNSKEGLSVKAIESADLYCLSVIDAIDLLLNPTRIAAGLRA